MDLNKTFRIINVGEFLNDLVGGGIWSIGGNVTVGWKESIRMPCRTVGQPSPKITWAHRGEALQVGDRLVAF